MYTEEGVLHYAVDNTPAMFPLTVTKILSNGNVCIFDAVIEDRLTPELENAVVIEKGHIRDRKVWDFRAAHGYFCR